MIVPCSSTEAGVWATEGWWLDRCKDALGFAQDPLLRVVSEDARGCVVPLIPVPGLEAGKPLGTCSTQLLGNSWLCSTGPEQFPGPRQCDFWRRWLLRRAGSRAIGPAERPTLPCGYGWWPVPTDRDWKSRGRGAASLCREAVTQTVGRVN